MNYLSVCSGIEAATVAWHDMGWKAVGYSEIEKFPSQLLAHHYPNVTNYGDMTKFKEWNINEPVNLLVGGTPCQSFSVAGLRRGLEDPRGNLMLTYLAMADHFKPKWLLWENVPGVLSSNGGHDFAALLQGMAELGYGFAYRVLDAQHFGVPQRRRRVFVVGCLGDWRSAAKVLFESESLRGNITPSRSEGQEIANCLAKSPASHSSYNPAGTLLARDYKGIDSYDYSKMAVTWPAEIASTLNASFGSKLGLENQHINSGAPLFVPTTVYETHPMDSRVKEMGDVCQTVTTRWGTDGGNIPLAENNMRVRRLTPMECERLQGFPDNYTNTPTSSDSTRYKALGNSMAVPVMKWIGERINNV
jgi:DNA (cytosine-5)-methyltransferase 1